MPVTYLPAYVAATAGVVVALDAAYALLKYATTGHAPRPYSALTDRYEAWRDAQLPRPEPVPPQELADRLRRLSAEVQAVTASSRPYSPKIAGDAPNCTANRSSDSRTRPPSIPAEK